MASACFVFSDRHSNITLFETSINMGHEELKYQRCSFPCRRLHIKNLLAVIDLASDLSD